MTNDGLLRPGSFALDEAAALLLDEEADSSSTSSHNEATRMRRLQSLPTMIEILTIEVLLDPTEPDSARIDAALNNGTAVNEMLADLNNGVYGAGVSWNASYTSRLHLTASLPAGSSVNDVEMRGAIQSAVAASLSIDVGAVRLRDFTTTTVPPAITMNPSDPNNPLNPGGGGGTSSSRRRHRRHYHTIRRRLALAKRRATGTRAARIVARRVARPCPRGRSCSSSVSSSSASLARLAF